LNSSEEQDLGRRALAYERFVRINLRRNIVAQLLQGMLGQTGNRVFNAPTFLPSYLFLLSGSDLIVGLARSLQALGTVISPMIGASLIGHRPRILLVGLMAGGLSRAQILGVALAGLWLSGGSAVAAILLFMMLMGFFQGIQGVVFNSLRAKVIPVNRRGLVSGLRNFLAGLTSAAIAYYAGSYFIDSNLLGNGYAALFLVAFGITMLGLACLGLTREPPSVTVKAETSALDNLKILPSMLRANKAFARFFFARSLGAFGRMSIPFYILYAHTKVELSGTMLGVLTTLWLLTGTTTNLFWGSIADRNGYRIVMIVGIAIWILIQVELLTVSGLGGLMIFFALVGMASGGFNMAGQNMVLEFGDAEDIPLRLAASSTAVNFIGMVGPVLGGAIAMTAGYEAVFGLCIALQTIALFVILLWVPEPRHQPRPVTASNPNSQS
jgi:MFS family permease